MSEREPPMESEWEYLTSLMVSGRGILITDPGPWDQIVVPLPKGAYEILVRKIHYPEESEPRVARVRATSSRKGRIGSVLGEVDVDSATIALFDARIEEQVAWDQEYYDQALTRAWASGSLMGEARWGEGDEDIFAFVSSGFGDSTYQVCEVIHEGQRVGVEVEFIKRGAAYPFK